MLRCLIALTAALLITNQVSAQVPPARLPNGGINKIPPAAASIPRDSVTAPPAEPGAYYSMPDFAAKNSEIAGLKKLIKAYETKIQLLEEKIKILENK